VLRLSKDDLILGRLFKPIVDDLRTEIPRKMRAANIPNLFFTYQGDAAIFEQDHMLYGNSKWRRAVG